MIEWADATSGTVVILGGWEVLSAFGRSQRRASACPSTSTSGVSTPASAGASHAATGTLGQHSTSTGRGATVSRVRAPRAGTGVSATCTSPCRTTSAARTVRLRALRATATCARPASGSRCSCAPDGYRVPTNSPASTAATATTIAVTSTTTSAGTAPSITRMSSRCARSATVVARVIAASSCRFAARAGASLERSSARRRRPADLRIREFPRSAA